MNQISSIDIGQYFLGGYGGSHGSAGPLSSLGGIGGLVTVFVRGAFILAGLVVLFFFIMAGIGIISGSGEGNAQKMEEAKKTATSALIGFIVVFASYWIVKLIGQVLNVPII